MFFSRPGFWGQLFLGGAAEPLNREETVYRDQVLEGSMPIARASLVLNGLDFDKPWAQRVEFIEALAALTSSYPDQVGIIRS